MNYQELKELVKKHCHLYYDVNRPEISDQEFDRLYDTLEAFEDAQGWADYDSPTKKVGGTSGKVKHKYKLFSLRKVYDQEDINPSFKIKTPKVDGANISIIYVDGKMVLAMTRGDGEFGEDVTHLVKHIQNVPTTVKSTHKELVINGECVTDNEVTNFRNYVSGALGLDSAEEFKTRNIKFIAHDWLGVDIDYTARMSVVKAMGFNTVFDTEFCSKYPHDGEVYRLDSYKESVELGWTSKYPRFSVALKPRGLLTAIAELQNVVWVVGRTGSVNPVGIVSPITLDGAVITRVTLHNIGIIEEHELALGDIIEIERAGGVIPKFLKVIDRTVEAVTEAADAIADYTKKVWDQNAALVEAKKQAEIAQALANKLKEQKDREAEQLRQIRDEERNTIEDRIKANNDLKGVLDDLEKQSLKLVNSKIHEANLQYKLSGLTSDYAKLIQAQADKEGVLAAIAGQRSEQKANDLALNREYNDMLKSQAQNINELAVNDKKFTTELIFNTLERLKAQKDAFKVEADLTLTRLQDNINLYKVGTQARVDAENEYNLKKQEIDQNIQLKDKEIRDAEIARINELNQIRIGLIRGTEQQATAALQIEYDEKFRLAQGDAEKLILLEQEKQKKLKEIKNAALIAEMQMASDALGSLIALNDSFTANSEKNAKRSFQINKALQLAQATINGVQSVMTVLADPTLVGPARYIAASIAGVTALANINKIAQTKFEPKGESGGGGGLTSNLGSFNQGGGGAPEGLTAQNTVTQLNPDGTIAGQGMNQQGAMKAYVVESESRAVTESQLEASYITVTKKSFKGRAITTLELLTNSTPAFLDELLVQMEYAYAKDTEEFVTTAVQGAGTLNATAQANSATGLLSYVSSAAAAVYSASLGFARNMIVTPEQWANIMSYNDAGRPIYIAANPQNNAGALSPTSLRGNVAGLDLLPVGADLGTPLVVHTQGTGIALRLLGIRCWNLAIGFESRS